MRFEFATASRIVFGDGAIGDVGALVRDLGRRALIVTGRSAARADRVRAELAAHGVDTTVFAISGEPEIDAVSRGAVLARQTASDVVCGIGGGSAIDGAKAIAALATNRADPFEYLEVVGRGQPLEVAPLPAVAIPTTAGTGSEVTRNAVLGVPQHGVKVSLRHVGMLPRVALVDPELTWDLPAEVTARTGLDAITQLIEPYLSSRATPITDALALDGLRLAAPAIRQVYRQGGDRDARRHMSLASLYGGVCLANAGLGAVHGFAGPLGGMFPAPHGAICAALLPHVMAGNLRALTARQPASPVLDRFRQVSAILTGRPTASAIDGVMWVSALVEDLQIPRLGAYGVTVDQVPAVVAKAGRASSMKSNPIVLTSDELAEILIRAI